jgi:hypothetical protein
MAVIIVVCRSAVYLVPLQSETEPSVDVVM